ncbi:MAG: VTT domain-containing protein [Actinomycetota bacterium]|nr:VTT domain-containing protein [Actinomycetota bacterium]
MKLLALTLVFGMVSSVVPVFNMETYIVLAYARSERSALELAVIGSLGQNIGKLVWYYVCRQSIDIPWFKKRLETPKRQAQFERWSDFVQGRPLVSGLLTFVSALIGVPPFFVMAMIAGTLRMNVVVFFVAGLLGRTLFFWAILGGAHLFLG